MQVDDDCLSTQNKIGGAFNNFQHTKICFYFSLLLFGCLMTGANAIRMRLRTHLKA